MSKKNNNTPAEEIKQENTAVQEIENEASEAVANEAPAKAEKAPKKKRRINTRSLKYGTMSVVLTVVFVAVVVVLNVIVGIISERFDTTADLTDGGIYSVDEATENYVKDVELPVTITVLNSETDFESLGSAYKQVNEVLKKLAMSNDKITLDYLILDQTPNFSSRFKGETLSANYIVVECETTGRHKILNRGDYFSVIDQLSTYDSALIDQYIQAYGTSSMVTGSQIEQAVVSALMTTTSNDPVRVAFTEGFGELDSSGLSALLSKNGYDVETISLSQNAEIDPDIDYIVMFAPTMDYDNENLSKLDRFLDNDGEFGKNVIYFASAQQPQTPNIESFLNDWGMSVGYSVIGQSDTQYIMSSYTGSYVHYQQITDTVYAGSTYGSPLFTYGADIRPVIQIWEGGDKGAVEQDVIMTTYDGAFLYPLDAGDDWDYTKAESGKFNDAVIAYRVQSTTQALSRVAVFGSDMLADSYFMSYSNSNNQDFFINMFNYISGRTEGVTITPKSFTYTGFDINQQQADILGVVLCIVIPVAVIVLGIVIWVRRRHR